MTKHKRKKSANTTNTKFSVEITGLILILIGVIGLGVFGPVGNIIKDFAIFLFGSYYNILIIILLVLGMYMLFKRKMPKFFTARLIGFYLIILSSLTLAHMNYVQSGTKIGDVLNNSMDVFLSVINENFVGLSQTGGGIIGLFISWALVSLLDKVGTYIIVSVIIIFGLILIFNISFSDTLDKIGSILASQKEKRKEAKKAARIAKANKQMEKEDEFEEEDDKVVIRSVEELKKYKTEDANWVSLDSFLIANYLGTQGLKVLNSTNLYPNINLWKKIDKEKKYNKVYNRYAHIDMELDNKNTKFELISPDHFKLKITPEDLCKLKVNYATSIKSLDEYNNSNVTFTSKYHKDNIYIYKVNCIGE